MSSTVGRATVTGDPGTAGIDREPRYPGRIWGRIRSWWRHLYRKIESRVVVEGDNETRRFQKVLVVVVASIGSIATLFNALALFRAGLESAGWAYVASAVFLLAGAVALLVWPHRYVVITFALLVDVLVFPGAVQVLSGGLASGLYALPWTIFAPLGAVLALGVRHAIVHLGLFVVTVMGVAALDPFARSAAPQVSAEAIASFNVPSLLSLGAIAGATSLYLLRQVDRFRIQADSLLLNVLPASIAARLKEEKTTIADRFEAVTVLFADIVGFTPLSSGAEPEVVVDMLNSIFSTFDDLAREHGIEKIKTIGDSYMAAAGLPEPRDDHAVATIEFALDILEVVQSKAGLEGRPLRLRIGINTGPVVAGVIGHDRFIYDLWGDTVNMASRMESNGVNDRIQVTRAVVDELGDRYRFEPREPIDIKGKGMTVTYLLDTDP
ncbi:MAG TPA: adenylate/guanylate cyclase domain-containing protein [Acidimicrobiia bacterium]|nr:adenylate/guanylate cyclase domain-containing protein [Acidimicrobiia bacterium]